VPEPPLDDSDDTNENHCHKESVMFSPIPAETLLRSHLDEARRHHRRLEQIAELKKATRIARQLP